ncbi:hypothetical protein Lal_00004301, partial [Lupinus albus]
MRMNVRRILLAWMLGVVVVGPTVAAENPSAKPVIGSASQQAVTGRPLSVLFVGNSYTFYNDLPRMVRQMSLDAAQPRPLDVRDVTFGGASLEAHWNRGVVQQVLASQHWDYVVIQDFSTMPVDNPEKTRKYVRLMAAEARKAGAQPILYLTWARQANPAMQAQLDAVYTGLANETHSLLAPPPELQRQLPDRLGVLRADLRRTAASTVQRADRAPGPRQQQRPPGLRLEFPAGPGPGPAHRAGRAAQPADHRHPLSRPAPPRVAAPSARGALAGAVRGRNLRQSRLCHDCPAPDDRHRLPAQEPRSRPDRRPPSPASPAPRAAQEAGRGEARPVAGALPGVLRQGRGAPQQRAAHALRRRPAHRRQARRDQGRAGETPGAGDRRRDRFGQDHPVAEDLPGDRPRHPRPDRPHPAAPAGRAQRGNPRGRGDRHAPGRTGGLPGALRGPVQRAQPDQADDRRHPPGRDPARPPARALRHDHRRRGPRAEPEHRLPPGLPEDPAATAPGPEADHHLGDHRPGALFQALRRCAHRRSLRPHLPGGHLVPAPGRRGGRERRAAVRRPGILRALDEIADHERAEGKRPGDVLVFLPGEREIRDAAEVLRKANLRHTEVLPLYARLTPAEQQKIFAPMPGRKIVLATNVAETSLTVPGIRYVIDSGTARISRYSYRAKVQRLPIEAVSQASANQRKGRCGRVEPGICVRLYSEEDFLGRPEFTDPEILRTNLAAVILQMLHLRLGEIGDFPFIEPPDGKAVSDGFTLLQELSAVNREGQLTPLGRQLARLPVDPRLGRMVLEGASQGSLDEVLLITSALSVQDPRERPMERQQAADQAHAQWKDVDSDFAALVNLWRGFEEQRQALGSNALRTWCRKNFLNYMRLREWRDAHRQLTLICRELKLSINKEPADYPRVHKALLSGLLSQIGQKSEDGDYLGARQRRFWIHPSTVIAKKRPQWIMAAELVETTKLFARMVAKIDPDWLEPLASHLVKKNHLEPHWEKRRGQVVAYEQVTLYGLIVVGRRPVHYGPIDPPVARELFIREGLVRGEIHSRAKCLAANRQLLERLDELEAKARRRDILADEETLFGYYAARLPEDIYQTASFEK